MSQEIQKLILDAIRAKVPNQGPCSFCGTGTFTLTEGYLSLDVTNSAVKGSPATTYLPSVALCCTNCGNTVLLNLIRLGLGDLIKPPEPTPPTPEEGSPSTGDQGNT
jgi:hypothetical protein